MSALTLNSHRPVDATAGPVTMTLPAGASAGTEVSCEKYDATANAVTITGNIRGNAGASISLTLSHETVTFRADAAGSWWPVSGHKTKTSLDAIYAGLPADRTSGNSLVFNPDGSVGSAARGTTAYTDTAVNTEKAARKTVTLSVTDFGAVGDGATNNYAAFAACIAAVVAAGGGTVFVPAGNFAIWATTRTTSTTTQAQDGHHIVINGSNIRLQGAGMNKSKVTCLGVTGAVATNDWQVVGGKVWRGGGVYVVSGAIGTLISDLEVDGTATPTGNVTNPAVVGTGDGWDITHKGVWLANGGTFDKTVIERCDIHHFRGEIVYAGGVSNGRVSCFDSELHHTNGDGWSCTGEITVERNHIHDVAACAIEDRYINKPVRYVNNKFVDCGQSGISSTTSASASSPAGPMVARGNTMIRCVNSAFNLGSPWNMIIEDNIVIDCGTGTTGNRPFLIYTRDINGPVRELRIRKNHVLYDTISGVGTLSSFTDTYGAGMSGIDIQDNTATVTAVGTAAGVTMQSGWSFSGITDSKARIRNNTARGATFSATDADTAFETLLTATSATVVAQRRPDRTTHFIVHVALRVVTAATTVTVKLTWYDASATVQTAYFANAVSQAVGSSAYAPICITAQGLSNSQMVTVTVTAATANQVYASATLHELR